MLSMRWILRGAAAIVIAVALTDAAPSRGETFSAYVDAKGNISLPTGYRTKWVFLGTWSIAGDEVGAKELHSVYARPQDVAGYRATGRWPDGAVLVKEVRKTATRPLTTGLASRAGPITVIFVMVKDAKGRFKGNRLWGEGWGWALFKAPDLTKQAATNFRTDCLGCHFPAKKSDWIYVDGYPVLRK
jgi:hypothetical protein